jgi:hypothetical protein
VKTGPRCSEAELVLDALKRTRPEISLKQRHLSDFVHGGGVIAIRFVENHMFHI